MQLWGITSGPDGNTWFTEENNNAVGRVTPGAVITEFTAGFPTGSPRGIVTGPDGNLWVAQAGGDGAIARVTKAGEVTEFPVPTAGDPNDIAVGPDGNLWYVDPGRERDRPDHPHGLDHRVHGRPQHGRRAELDRQGRRRQALVHRAGGGQDRQDHHGRRDHGVQQQPVRQLRARRHRGRPRRQPLVHDERRPGKHRPDHSHGRRHGVQRRPDHELEARSASPPGPDGALWFTESAAPGRIGRITTEGHITEYSSGLVAITNPWFIAAGPDGNMWFTGNNAPGRVARITLPPLVKDLAADQIGTGSARLRGRVRPNSQATTYHFEYGPTADYGMTTPSAYAGSSYDLTQVLATVDGLAPVDEVPLPRRRGKRRRGHHRAGPRVRHGRAPGDARRRPLAAPEPKPETPEFAKTIVAEGDGVRYKAPGGSWQELPIRRRASGRRGVRRPPRKGQPHECRLPGRHPDRHLRRRRLLRAPAALRLRTGGRVPARRKLQALRAARPPRKRPPRLRLEDAPRPADSGAATAAASTAATAATATPPCAARAG